MNIDPKLAQGEQGDRTQRLLHAGILVRHFHSKWACWVPGTHTRTCKCKCRETLVLLFVHCSRPKHNEADWGRATAGRETCPLRGGGAQPGVI